MINSELELSAEPNDCCFVRGANNLHGLRLSFHNAGDAARADWCSSAAWETFRNIIHGGVVSVVLDEAMCKAIAVAGFLGATCDLRVRLRLHVEPGEELYLLGWMVDERRIVAKARLTTLDGHEKAHAWAHRPRDMIKLDFWCEHTDARPQAPRPKALDQRCIMGRRGWRCPKR
jgi:hypothetical protein